MITQSDGWRESPPDFEALIGDPEILRGLLEGFLHDWPGVVDVMLAGPSHRLLFDQRGYVNPFCERVKRSSQGKKLCIDCDTRLAEEAADNKAPVSSLCDAGVSMVAVPILVEGEAMAIILWGQCGPEEEQAPGCRRAKDTEAESGFVQGELLPLWQELPRLPSTDVEEIKSRLSRIAEHLASQRHQTLELERTKAELEKLLKETEAIQGILGTLMGVVDVEQFWHKLDTALSHICETIGASMAAIFVSERPDNGAFTVKSVAGLPREAFVDKGYPGSDLIIRSVLDNRRARIISFDPSNKESICHDISLLCPENLPDRVALVPFSLAGGQNAIMSLFVNRGQDTRHSLHLDGELPLLTQAVPQIATAFRNCQLFAEQARLAEERRKMAIERDSWFEDVSHQLIAPLSGLQADADRLIRFYDQWEEDRILNQLRAIQSISRWAARLTRNFDWAVRIGSIAGGPTRTRWTRLKAFLIGCAIDVQGLAATKRVRVHVDDSVDELWDVRIDRMRFNQAIVNLLDNAVKYSNNGTEVRVSAELADSELCVRITNYGIPLGQEHIDQIFQRGYRTEAAKAKVVVGTGIGLPIAAEIVRHHGGDITVAPSVFSRTWNAHMVTFTVKLPRSAVRKRRA